MGYVDENGYDLINEEHKVRLSLSEQAWQVLSEDMFTFSETRESTFLNTILENYRDLAKSSIHLRLSEHQESLLTLLSGIKLTPKLKEEILDSLLTDEQSKLEQKVKERTTLPGTGKLYHLNNSNLKYLLEECEEDRYFPKPAQYIRAVIEEYCALPFIERERIYKRPLFEEIERACRSENILEIRIPTQGTSLQSYIVYPYSIMEDRFHTQLYLVCYSRKKGDLNMKIVSFSMARLNDVRVLRKTFHLNKEEKREIEDKVSKDSVAYLIGDHELTQVRLSKAGETIYRNKLFGRPQAVEIDSKKGIYTFDCTTRQAINYFFIFGKEAEILAPDSLREEFAEKYRDAAMSYSSNLIKMSDPKNYGKA